MRKIIEQYLGDISEKVNPEDVDLSSFEVHKTLSPKIWTEDNKLKPEVKNQLLSIAEDYMDSLDIPWVEYTDVRLTGSLANYNWSELSDIDLHIMINSSSISDNPELVEEYLASKKKIWNDQHNIKIYGYDVECYAQDINEKHTSSGVYSVENDKWVVKPSIEKPRIDKEIGRAHV